MSKASPNSSPTKEIEDEHKDDANKGKIWINAWYDPLANVCAHSSCMSLCDINGDGDSKLIIASSGANPLMKLGLPVTAHRLKVYKGMFIDASN
jgi:hypothetical protein